MPEATQSIIEVVVGVVVALLVLLGFRSREKAGIDARFSLLHKRATIIDGKIHLFREDVAKNYPSRVTMREEMQSLEKNIKTELKAHSAEVINVIRNEIEKAVNK